MKPDTRPIFSVRLRAEAGDGIRGLKATLKVAMRRHHLRCIEAVEESSDRVLEELQAEPDRAEVEQVLKQYDELVQRLARSLSDA
jgi:hypothetical protein